MQRLLKSDTITVIVMVVHIDISVTMCWNSNTKLPRLTVEVYSWHAAD